MPDGWDGRWLDEAARTVRDIRVQRNRHREEERAAVKHSSVVVKKIETSSLPTFVVDHRSEADREIAREIAELVRAKPDAVLGLPTGNTPVGVYAELVRLHREQGLSFVRITTFNVDEYLGLTPGHPRTFRRWMHEHFFDHVDVRPENIRLPDAGLPPDRAAEGSARYEAAIQAAGGIDLLVLGIGTNGHIGFNEPGSTRETRTRVVDLDAVTRADAAAAFGRLDAVPVQAITIGVATILDARAIRVMALGTRKAAIVARTLSDPVGPALPATFLREQARVTLHLDREAAVGIANGSR
jgi:glucosamine-6-phosphate deaminase